MILKRLLAGGVALVASLGGLSYFETHVPTMASVRLAMPKLAACTQLSVVQLTDVHDQPFDDGGRDLLARIQALKPDLIAVTGDLIDSKTQDFGPMYRLAEQLVRIAPTYHVSGNHEWWNGRIAEFRGGLAARGVQQLNNARTIFRKGTFELNLCGVDDPYTGRADPARALNGLDLRKLTLLLAHAPEIVYALKPNQADLVLAGHTHGGQVRVPGIGAIVAPGQGFFPKYDKGLFTLRPDEHLYVDSGLGTSILPIRLFNRAQFSHILLHPHAN